MINFRPLPTPADTYSNIPVPTTWPQGLYDKALALDQVTAAWDPWWADVSPSYKAKLVTYPLSIRSIAHALHLELTNGWSFDFCLRYCEENLMDAPYGIRASPTIGKLTSRARAGVDEQIASAVTVALAAADGFRFLGDIQRYAKKYPSMVSRRWKGNGPDHIAAQFGSPANGQVANFRFLEAKGNAVEFSHAKPRDFCIFKTQSLNADLLFACQIRPILSYVYLPATADPLVAQWFNAPTRQIPKESELGRFDRASQAFLLLSVARDQYVRIMRKSRRAGIKTLTDGRVWIISQDGLSGVAIDREVRMVFAKIGNIIRSIREPADLEKNVETLLEAVNSLQNIAKVYDDPRAEIHEFSGTRYEVIARDATGFIFLRRA
ncbi:Uncharacterised protein [Burkholderia cepacia]|uniref:Uncharacterized protein n=2 Tax=Burkholderia cepacia TaxID=292 RepID=A0AAE8NA44_BURCE|nr:Uncharacterised protein [Burkholderia cepacia]